MADMILVFLILAGTIVLFVTDRFRLDLVAMLSLLALMLTGILTVPEALSGFSDPLVLIIAGLFVVGAGLFNTGVANRLGEWLGATAGSNPTRIVVMLMLVVALLSAVMSSTGAVAVLLPVTISLARDAKTPPSKLMMPLAFGSLIGGMLTLIGTPPNLVVSEQLRAAGYEPFRFFAFTPIGLAVLLVGIAYMVWIGRRLLPTGGLRLLRSGDVDNVTIAQLAGHYELDDDFYRLRVRRLSPLVDMQLEDSQIGAAYSVTVLDVQPWPDGQPEPLPPRRVSPETRLRAHDIVTVRGTAEDVMRLCRDMDLGVRPRDSGRERISVGELGMAEVLIRGRSSLIGKTLQEARLRNAYDINVIGLKRRNAVLHDNLATTPLRFGDTLLVQGTWTAIQRLTEERNDFVVVGLPRELVERDHSLRKSSMAVLIVTAMLVVMTLQLLPTVTAVLSAAVAMVLTGCVRAETVYGRINWESVILIAAMLPMATALEKTGGVLFVADGLTGTLGAYGPMVVMVGLFMITLFFSQFISNTATTVLIAPIALQAAMTLGLTPYAFLMTVAIAASAAFATPIASPVNTLILGPAEYRFMDFVRTGVPLQLLVLLITLLLVPRLFPWV